MPATPCDREITFLNQDEVRSLLAAIPGRRDRALFHLAYHHGLRASEVSLLLREDLDRRRGRLHIHRVKGSVSGVYPVQPEDLRRLSTYLKSRQDDSPYLFVSNRRAPLERRSYWDLMQR